MLRISRVCFVLLVVAAGFIGIRRLDYNVDVLNLLPQDLPGLEGTRVLRDQRADRLILCVEAPESATASAVTDGLSAHLASRPDLCSGARHAEALESGIDAIAEAAAYAWWNAPPGKAEELTARLEPARLDADLAKSLESLATSFDGRELALQAYDPLGLVQQAVAILAPQMVQSRTPLSGFSSADGRLRLIHVKSPHGPETDYRGVAAWIADLRAEANAWKAQHPEFAAATLRITGEMAFRAEISTGMEGDMKQSIGGVTIIVALLFWLLHRSLKPLFWLLLAIFAANLLALGAAGLLYGSLNVMSVGFAAILTGLIEDFGVVGLHEAQEHPGEGYRAVLRRVFPGVAWSAVTVAAIFGMLGFSQLPGVAQLGVLCALGVLIGAGVMLFGFLPLAMHCRLRPQPAALASAGRNFRRFAGPLTLAIAVLCSAGVLLHGWPEVNTSPAVLRPRHSEANDTLERILEKMAPAPDAGVWVPVVADGATPEELRGTLSAMSARVAQAESAGEVISHFMPASLVPDAAAQSRNAPLLAAAAAQEERLVKAIDAAGFNEDAVRLPREILRRWKEWAAAGTALRWPDPQVTEGSMGALLARRAGRVEALGYAVIPSDSPPASLAVMKDLSAMPGVKPGGWDYLNSALKPILGGEVRRVALPALIGVLILLPLVFRGLREITFAVGTLAVSGLILCGVMAFAGLSWNMVSVGSVALALGLGLDFTIHIIYALRRHPHDPAAAAGMGRALAYCGLSTGLAFGSLALGSNEGLVNLGLCTMIGVLAVLFTAAFALPWVWHRLPPPRGNV